MKHICCRVYYKIVLILIAAGFSACKQELISNPEQYARLYIVQAGTYPAVRTFIMKDEVQTIDIAAARGGIADTGQDIDVTFKVDNALIQDFNEKNNTAYAALPEGSYELEKTSATIRKGERVTSPLKIRLKTLGTLVAFKQYLLPVSLSADAAVNEDLKTAYFLIEGQREGINIRVMSLDKGAAVTNLNTVADVIKANNPDLLLVKAMDINTLRSGKVDQVTALSQLIGMPNYLFATSIASFDGGTYGCAVFSKYPIVKNDTYILPTGDTNAEKGPLGVITVQVNDNNKLVFAGTQLNSNATRRAAQLPELLRIIQTYNTDPLILAGNFNDTPPAGSVYAGLAGIGMNFPCTSCPPNNPAANPTAYSDFMLYKTADRFRVQSYTVGSTTTSTHLPVITQFTLYY
ncbi:endonuclease/exonuclease/phosphatase family metal-dependent hydrolase [Pedobacter africanus]|uniref:Endonuclease/exonuclease/phosphatase family metal-dependent hydrolase n=1 Tax=Pedobacter africanus TaxID=151894 RepID=A0ACC6KQV9_9SPHI|nr:DUF1735 domain-containing protein [Pedobacter africanus]MDR6781545.1 endonuclease/exonuclease/phosphatase family metal-dependent hydrolase [Pedobacter africanus]